MTVLLHTSPGSACGAIGQPGRGDRLFDAQEKTTELKYLDGSISDCRLHEVRRLTCHHNDLPRRRRRSPQEFAKAGARNLLLAGFIHQQQTRVQTVVLKRDLHERNRIRPSKADHVARRCLESDVVVPDDAGLTSDRQSGLADWEACDPESLKQRLEACRPCYQAVAPLSANVM